MTWLIVLGIVLASVAVFVLVLPWMRRQQSGWARRFIDWIEPFELRWWKKSETVLFSKALEWTGIVTFVLDILIRVTGFIADLDPLMLAPLMPQHSEYIGPALYAIGLVNRMLRERTTKPTELVAVPSNAPVEVQVAVEQAASMNAVAVQIVQDAKASGAIKS